jgi:5-methylcytosine-specific restriction endonuclease McrA
MPTRIKYAKLWDWDKTPDAIERKRFYKGPRWRALRDKHLRRFPTCVACGHLADQVHHAEDRLKNPARAYDSTNLLSYCASCHSKETRRRQLEGNPDA